MAALPISHLLSLPTHPRPSNLRIYVLVKELDHNWGVYIRPIANFTGWELADAIITDWGGEDTERVDLRSEWG